VRIQAITVHNPLQYVGRISEQQAIMYACVGVTNDTINLKLVAQAEEVTIAGSRIPFPS
jgi:hypothetical protein